MPESGTFWGVSVGTGDPEGLTLKALRILQSVPVITVPHNPQRGSSRAYDIIKDQIPARLFGDSGASGPVLPFLGIQPQRVIPLDLPFIQDPQALAIAWQVAADLIGGYLQQGEDVAFACEGDVGLYSTFGHLADAVRRQDSDCVIERIPGVCSPLAAAAALGIPLGVVQDKIAILPAMYHADELTQALDWAEVVVLMKVKAVYQQVWDLLQQRDLLDQASLALEVGGSQQQLWSGLRGQRDLQLPYFAILIIRTHPPQPGTQ